MADVLRLLIHYNKEVIEPAARRQRRLGRRLETSSDDDCIT